MEVYSVRMLCCGGEIDSFMFCIELSMWINTCTCWFPVPNNTHLLIETQDKGEGALPQLDGGCTHESSSGLFSNLGKSIIQTFKLYLLKKLRRKLFGLQELRGIYYVGTYLRTHVFECVYTVFLSTAAIVLTTDTSWNSRWPRRAHVGMRQCHPGAATASDGHSLVRWKLGRAEEGQCYRHC